MYDSVLCHSELSPFHRFGKFSRRGQSTDISWTITKSPWCQGSLLGSVVGAFLPYTREGPFLGVACCSKSDNGWANQRGTVLFGTATSGKSQLDTMRKEKEDSAKWTHCVLPDK